MVRPPPTGPVSLEWCDIIRDGGSYACRLHDGADKVALVLRVGAWDHPSEIEYETLHIGGDDGNPAFDAPSVPAGSAVEREWLELLEAADTTNVSENDIRRFREMLAIVRGRHPND